MGNHAEKKETGKHFRFMVKKEKNMEGKEAKKSKTKMNATH